MNECCLDVVLYSVSVFVYLIMWNICCAKFNQLTNWSETACFVTTAFWPILLSIGLIGHAVEWVRGK